MNDIENLRKSAEIAFHSLAEKAGFDPAGYTCGAQWIKDDANRLHIVQRYDMHGTASVVLKYAMRPVDAVDFGKILDAHHQAQSALKGQTTATVPQILAEDRDAQAYLMTFHTGKTFLELCRSNEDHTPFLTSAGQWLSAYHAATFEQERAFQPKFMLRHMQHLVGQMTRGERKIRGQKRFISLVGQMDAMSVDADGHVGKIAAKHGDLNAHNLLIGQGSVAAYDFLAQSNAPVAYDIARILLSYSQMVGQISNIPKGQIIPPQAKGAFFEGYRFVDQNDPTVDFLMRVQILTDWNRMQHKTNLNSVLRFERLRAIARRAFA